MSTGSIKFFSPGKVQGFITADEDGTDVFFNAHFITSDTGKKLNQGTRVSYDLVPNAIGSMEAKNIQPIT